MEGNSEHDVEAIIGHRVKNGKVFLPHMFLYYLSIIFLLNRKIMQTFLNTHFILFIPG